MCLPKSFSTSSNIIKIPRSKPAREYLVSNGLVGKIRLLSSMTEDDIMKEIRSVFKTAMWNDPQFEFVILQPSGGGSKSLTILARSSSYKWTAAAVAGPTKSPIYILALASLKVSHILPPHLHGKIINQEPGIASVISLLKQHSKLVFFDQFFYSLKHKL